MTMLGKNPNPINSTVTLRRQILLIVLALIIAFVLAQGVLSFAQPSMSAATGGQEVGNQGVNKSMSYTQEAPTALSSLSIYASSSIKDNSPVELLVTGPNGQQTGFDVETGTILQNIPDSSYGTDSIEDDVDPTTWDPTPEVKSFEAGWPTSGNYLLQIIGTGSGPYTIDILAYDSTGALSQQTITEKATSGVGTVYQVRYSSVAGTRVSKTFMRNVYIITATAASGGSISPSGITAINSGSNKTFTILPDAGYSVARVTVDGASKGAITRYTFDNITAPHTIAVTFAKTTTKPPNP